MSREGTGRKALDIVKRQPREPHIVGARSQSPIGLASSPKPFRCGDCKYFYRAPHIDGACKNPNPELDGEHVEPNWCCNLYDHPGMKVIK